MPHELVSLPSGTACLHLETVGSTNAEAIGRALDGESGPLWILADRQTAGRGRSGRTWASTSGNLHASLLLPLAVASQAVPKVSLIAGISAIDAIRSASGALTLDRLCLKWPNDLLIGGAKVGGILVETTNVSSGRIVVIGFGVNLLEAPQVGGRQTTALADHGVRALPLEMVGNLDAALAAWLAIWSGDANFPAVLKAWQARSLPLGTPLSVNRPPDVAEGVYAGLDDDGAMLLEIEGQGLERITYGDVVLVGPAGNDLKRP